MVMIRSFLNVGQGAFYTECFEGDERKINIVYDCGSEKSTKFLFEIIKSVFKKDEEIDAIFISHLHQDHIKGIPDLLEYCKVKKIYFPLITEEDKSLLKISYKIEKTEKGFAYAFLDDPMGAVNDIIGDNEKYKDDKPKLIGVKEYDGNESNMQNELRGESYKGISIMESGQDVFNDIFDSLIGSIGSSPFQWSYIPFNFKQKERVKELLDNLKKEFRRSVKKNEIEQLWKKDTSGERKKIKDAYSKVKDNLNTNSMTLYSGDGNSKLNQFRTNIYTRCRM